jgi:outer membrane protein TolC
MATIKRIPAIAGREPQIERQRLEKAKNQITQIAINSHFSCKPLVNTFCSTLWLIYLLSLASFCFGEPPKAMLVTAGTTVDQLIPGPVEPPQIAAPQAGSVDIEALQSELPEPLRAAIEPLPEPENPSALTLSDVIASVYRSFPTLEAIRLQRDVASGNLTTSWGEFDTKILAETMNEPTGYYENYRHNLGLARNLWWGGYLSSGYRVGRGDFQPWYKERETLDSGEFKLTYIQPLLQGRNIDPRRVAIFQNRIAEQQVEPQLQSEVLRASLDAAIIYWEWLAAGRTLRVQQQLLDLAKQRVAQIQELIKAERRAKVDELFNNVLIAQRLTKVIETQRKLQQSSFKLALFLRDSEGEPMVPPEVWLPTSFPPLSESKNLDPQQQINEALDRRPELIDLQLQNESVMWDRRLAQNQTMARLDFFNELSQDVGPANSKNFDKQPFESEFGLSYEYPWQLRKARGKLRATAAKMQQIDQKTRLQIDKISLEVQSAIVALQRSQEVIDQLVQVVQTQAQVLELQEIQFANGRIDLIELNLQEQLVTNLKSDLIAAQKDWFVALSELSAVSGLDPLEQALRLETLPEPGKKPNPAP